MATPRCWLDRVCSGAQYVVLAWLVAGGVYFAGWRDLRAQVPSMEVLSEQLRQMRDDVGRLRDQRIDVRLALVEDTLLEVKWLGRTAAGALIVQIITQLRDRRRRAS